MKRLGLVLLCWLAFVLAGPLHAQSFPKLTGRVVDAANLLDPAQEAQLTTRLATLEQQSGRQLVVATIPDLGDHDISDYGYRLGRAWGIGSKDKNDGALLIVAPKEREVRIEVGYGLEGILTDALSSRIIRNDIVPHFKANDYPGGIIAGTQSIATLLALPPEEARRQAAAAAAEQQNAQSGSGGVPFVFILFLLFFVLPMFFRRGRGRRRYGDSALPVVLWGSMLGGGDRSSGWGSGGGGWGGGGGGFGGGGGGSFGGGGSSGSW
ncbi:TPM domain-containing protein [Sphingobium subterraneum]|uniref:TPM domain-containing protein n=1 Tax=Sphingobium subterraneum TaxID=627688 RepID=A0A841IVM2_9SPHN|nr:TPM domain-containing protein [Sphingobium subterraneum]MBB6122707.1 uncharacterized protein [Sphingobium subterraneum]